MRAVLLTAALVCGFAATAIGQTLPDDPPVYVIEYSTAPMIRNAALADVTLRVADRGSTWLFDKWHAGIFARLGETTFSVFINSLGQAVVHEYGHVARVEERGGSARAVIALSGSFFRGTIPSLAPAERLSIFGGGLEGTAVLSDRVGDRIHARGTATPGELTLLVTNALQSEGYILTTLSERCLTSPLTYFEGGPRGLAGDPAQYVSDLTLAGLPGYVPERGDAALFALTQTTARRVRHGSWINFVDYELAGAVFGLSRDFIQRGERRIPVRWLHVGGLALSPGLRYTLSPNGPERQVRTRYKIGPGVGEGYFRWTDPLPSLGTRLMGAGGEYQHRMLRGFVPKVSLDLWRNPDGHASARTELAAGVQRAAKDRLSLSFAVGGKGRGYRQGYPLAPGIYVNVGAGLRF